MPPRNLDSASKDYREHLGELGRKIVQIVDAALRCLHHSHVHIFITVTSPVNCHLLPVTPAIT